MGSVKVVGQSCGYSTGEITYITEDGRRWVKATGPEYTGDLHGTYHRGRVYVNMFISASGNSDAIRPRIEKADLTFDEEFRRRRIASRQEQLARRGIGYLAPRSRAVFSRPEFHARSNTRSG